MKVLVLCAGRGSRLRPLTHTRAKAALPVAGRPVLSHILSYLYRFGFADVGVVISPGQEELKQLPPAAAEQQVAYILQRSPQGIAHAVRMAEPFLNGEPFLLYLGDNLTDEELSPALIRFQNEQPDALLAVRTVTNPQAFGIAEVEGERVVRVEEKPQVPESNLAIAGIYLFSPAIFQAIGGLRPSARGEYEITDAIRGLIRLGKPVIAHRMTSWWQDMGSPEGLLQANSNLLDRISTHIDPDVVLTTAQIQGRVVIEKGVRLENVRLRGPLLLGQHSFLRNAYVGPYTSVGEWAQIMDASVENSILLPHCRLEALSVHLEDSLLGHKAVAEAKSGRSITIWLGDDGHLQIPRD